MDTKAHQDKIWALLSGVPDPEIPVISIVELGVVRSVCFSGNEVEVVITPTYTGCPATNVFEQDIRSTLAEAGYSQVTITYQYAPAWTTDWLNTEAREKLRNFGIAPPEENTTDKRHLLGMDPVVRCVNCGSTHTKMVSQFGSTACKALYSCEDCQEPFDYFKCI